MGVMQETKDGNGQAEVDIQFHLDVINKELGLEGEEALTVQNTTVDRIRALEKRMDNKQGELLPKPGDTQEFMQRGIDFTRADRIVTKFAMEKSGMTTVKSNDEKPKAKPKKPRKKPGCTIM